ncbi:MAG: hypothetical protein ACI4WX_06680 [Aristaeellaceae bacterium]
MSDVKDFLRDVGYFSVGAAAVIVEAGDKAIKCLVRKGEKTLRDHQDTVDELKRKAKDAGEKIKDAAQKAVVKPESAPADGASPVDAAAMSAEERAELRRQLDEADAADAQPAAPDAVYHTSEPLPEEDAVDEEEPEDSANG